MLNWELLNICARITVNGMQTGTIPPKHIRMSQSLVSYSFDILFLELRKNLKDFLVKGEFTACYSTFWFLCFSFLIPKSLQVRLCLQMANFDDKHSTPSKDVSGLSFIF